MIGSKIKDYLKENGIKQGFVAEKVGISDSAMSDICNKDKPIECTIYYNICKVLNVPFGFFIEET